MSNRRDQDKPKAPKVLQQNLEDRLMANVVFQNLFFQYQLLPSVVEYHSDQIFLGYGHIQGFEVFTIKYMSAFFERERGGGEREGRLQFFMLVQIHSGGTSH